MPFEINVSFSAQFIDNDRFVIELQRSLRRLMREVAGLYYNTIIAGIPVDTGFLAGSFLPIKQAAGTTNVTPVSPRAQPRPTFYTHFGNQRTLKNPETGIAYVTKPEDVLREITDLATKYLITFLFNNEIRYYPINDVHGTRLRPAWHVTEKATRAALAYIDANLPNILPSTVQFSVKHVLISYRPGFAPQRIKV